MADAAVQAAIYRMGLDASDYHRGVQAVDQGNTRIVDSLIRVERASGRTGSAIANNNRALETGGRGFSSFGSRVQNSAFQAADFFVQIESGTPIMRAATQQGSQFLAAFGPWGAVIGAAAAILGVLVTKLDLFGSSAGDAGVSVKDLELKQGQGTTAADLYTLAIERANDVLRTQEERADAAAGAQGRLAKQTTVAAIQMQQAALMEMQVQKAIREEQAAMERANPSAIAGAEGRITGEQPGVNPVLFGINAQIEATKNNMRTLKEQLSALNDPAQHGDARDEAAKAAEKAAKAGQKQADEREQARQAIEDQIDALSREAEQLGMTAKARAVDVELQRAEATARRGNIELTDVQIEALTMEAEKKFEAAEAAEALKDAERDRIRLIKEQLREQKRAEKELERDLERQTNLLLDQALVLRGLIDGTFDWRDATLDAVETILRELAKLQTFGGTGGGMFGAGGFLQLLLGIGGAAAGGMFPGGVGAPAAGAPILSGMFAAEGGEGVVTKPTLFLAGEKGAERFKFTPVPKAANDGSGSVMYQINIAGDADEAKIERVLTRHIPNITKAAENRVMRRAGQSVGGANAWMRSP